MREIYVLSNILAKPLANILSISLKDVKINYMNTVDVPLTIDSLYPKNNEFVIISDKLSDKEISELDSRLNQKNNKLVLYIINVDDQRDLTKLSSHNGVYIIDSQKQQKQISELQKIIEGRQ